MMNTRGSALIEFALILPVMFGLLAIVVDLGFCFSCQISMLRGLTTGALYAFENSGDISSGNAESFRRSVAAVVLDSAGSSASDVSVLLNNSDQTAAADQYYCTSGKPTVWQAAGTSPVGCADGTTATKFVTIRVSRTQAALIPFASVGEKLFPLSQTIVVRGK